MSGWAATFPTITGDSRATAFVGLDSTKTAPVVSKHGQYTYPITMHISKEKDLCCMYSALGLYVQRYNKPIH